MSIKFNQLGIYRKRHHLKQADVSFLIGQQTTSYLSRCESGDKQPSLELLLAYRLLFGVPIQHLLPLQTKNVERLLQQQIPLLIDQLTQEANSVRSRKRLQAMHEISTRLTLERK